MEHVQYEKKSLKSYEEMKRIAKSLKAKDNARKRRSHQKGIKGGSGSKKRIQNKEHLQNEFDKIVYE